MKKVEYYISTGVKEEFYTLWKEVILYDDKNKPYYLHLNFIQNLSKTREGAINKAKDLGYELPSNKFDIELKHLSKPSLEAYGTKLKYNKGKWYANATEEFFQAWKKDKIEMKNLGWSCWKYESIWFMAITPKEGI